MNWGNKTS